MSFLSIDELLLINQWAQGIRSDEEIKGFIDRKSQQDMHSLLVWTGELARQASAEREDALNAIKEAPFKPTRSASVLLSKDVSLAVYRKMETLKGGDGKDAALLFLLMFKIADKRLRSIDDRCYHWWHRDLSNENVVAQIKRDYEAGVLE